jgi:hypothetical protein
LAGLHLSADQLSGVIEILADVQAADEARKLAQRERARKSRASRDRNVTVTPASRDVPRAGVAHVEDKSLPSELEPQKQGSLAKRATRLAEDWVLPVEWRADALEAELPESLISLEAEKMRDWSRSAKNGAKIDWHAAWRNWAREAASRLARAGPGRRERPDHFKNYARELNGQAGNTGSDGRDWDDAPGVPIRAIQHHG